MNDPVLDRRECLRRCSACMAPVATSAAIELRRQCCADSSAAACGSPLDRRREGPLPLLLDRRREDPRWAPEGGLGSSASASLAIAVPFFHLQPSTAGQHVADPSGLSFGAVPATRPLSLTLVPSRPHFLMWQGGSESGAAARAQATRPLPCPVPRLPRVKTGTGTNPDAIHRRGPPSRIRTAVPY